IRGVTCAQNGGNEKTLVFDVALFDQVAAVVQPRRRRRLTEEQKARLRQAATPEQRAEWLAKARTGRAGSNAHVAPDSVGQGNGDSEGLNPSEAKSLDRDERESA